MIRQSHFIAVVGALLMGCVVLVVVGCAGVRSEASKQEEQGHTEATKEQTRSPEATTEEARCEGTRTYQDKWSDWLMTTNGIPGCPNGGLLSGTDGRDRLGGKDGDDEIHGLGDKDRLFGGMGSDVIYGGPGDDPWLYGDRGDDVIYGGDGNDGGVSGLNPGEDMLPSLPQMYGGPGEDVIYGRDGNDALNGTGDGGQRDKLYCGKGRDHYLADTNDYVDSSCEKKGGIP